MSTSRHGDGCTRIPVQQLLPCDHVDGYLGVMGRKRWSELSPATRTAIVVAGLAEIVVTSIALRDLVRRPAALVRGPKPLWGVALFVQPVGSPLYLLFGRRRPPVEAT